jgi:hypothetical protein
MGSLIQQSNTVPLDEKWCRFHARDARLAPIPVASALLVRVTAWDAAGNSTGHDQPAQGQSVSIEVSATDRPGHKTTKTQAQGA